MTPASSFTNYLRLPNGTRSDESQLVDRLRQVMELGSTDDRDSTNCNAFLLTKLRKYFRTRIPNEDIGFELELSGAASACDTNNFQVHGSAISSSRRKTRGYLFGFSSSVCGRLVAIHVLLLSVTAAVGVVVECNSTAAKLLDMRDFPEVLCATDMIDLITYNVSSLQELQMALQSPSECGSNCSSHPSANGSRQKLLYVRLLTSIDLVDSDALAIRSNLILDGAECMEHGYDFGCKLYSSATDGCGLQPKKASEIDDEQQTLCTFKKPGSARAEAFFTTSVRYNVQPSIGVATAKLDPADRAA